MESDIEIDCSCIPPPPSFDLAPPPKPDSLQWVSDDDDQGSIESCPYYLFDTTVTNFVQELESSAQISQPLFNLMIMSVSLVLLLLLGSCTVIWCRKRRRCLLKKNSKSHLPVTEKLLPGMNSVDHNRNGLATKISNEDDPTYAFTKTLHPVTRHGQTYQSASSDNKRISIYDTLNPVYEEISLENLASDAAAKRVKNRPADNHRLVNNKCETIKLLTDNSISATNDKRLCIRQCDNCKLRQSSRDGNANGEEFIYCGAECRCSFISLPNDDHNQIYRTKYSDRILSEDYRQTAYV